MKNMLMAKLAVAVLLVLGTFLPAQDETEKIPPVDRPVPDDVSPDNQSSVSDEVLVPGQVESVAPVPPPVPVDPVLVEQGAIYSPAPVMGTSEWLGSGQAAPITFGNIASDCSGCSTSYGWESTPYPVARCGTACCPPRRCPMACCRKTFCNSGCNSRGCKVACVQPAATTCGCSTGCGNAISQVSYDQPIYQTAPIIPAATSVVVAAPSTVVNPAPALAPNTMIYTPPVVNTGCPSCGTTTPTYVAACNNCTPTRGRIFRGRRFRNR